MTQCCDLIIEVGNTESSIHNVNQQVINILSLSHLCLQEYIESKVLTLSCLDKYKKDKICAQVPIESCTSTYVPLSHTFVKIVLLKSTQINFIKLTIVIYVCIFLQRLTVVTKCLEIQINHHPHLTPWQGQLYPHLAIY